MCTVHSSSSKEQAFQSADNLKKSRLYSDDSATHRPLGPQENPCRPLELCAPVCSIAAGCGARRRDLWPKPHHATSCHVTSKSSVSSVFRFWYYASYISYMCVNMLWYRHVCVRASTMYKYGCYSKLFNMYCDCNNASHYPWAPCHGFCRHVLCRHVLCATWVLKPFSCCKFHWPGEGFDCVVCLTKRGGTLWICGVIMG